MLIMSVPCTHLCVSCSVRRLVSDTKTEKQKLLFLTDMIDWIMIDMIIAT